MSRRRCAIAGGGSSAVFLRWRVRWRHRADPADGSGDHACLDEKKEVVSVDRLWQDYVKPNSITLNGSRGRL